MAKRTDRVRGLLASVANQAGDARPETGEQMTQFPVPGALVDDREAAGKETLEGKRERRLLRRVPVSATRMHPMNNRLYDRLDETWCADLIESFKAQGQQMPAIARIVKDAKDDVHYEIVCGSRRRWTADHLNMLLQIEIRDLTDIEAYLLIGAENRDRLDDTDYEKAVYYLSGLDTPGYFKSQGQLANATGVSDTTISRLLNIARLPADVLDAFGDRRLVTKEITIKLRKLLDRDQARVLEMCRSIITSVEQGEETQPSAGEVVKRLTNALAEQKPAAKAVTVYRDGRGKAVIKKTRKGAKVNIEINLDGKRLTIEAVDAVLDQLAKDGVLRQDT